MSDRRILEHRMRASRVEHGDDHRDSLADARQFAQTALSEDIVQRDQQIPESLGGSDVGTRTVGIAARKHEALTDFGQQIRRRECVHSTAQTWCGRQRSGAHPRRKTQNPARVICTRPVATTAPATAACLNRDVPSGVVSEPMRKDGAGARAGRSRPQRPDRDGCGRRLTLVQPHSAG